jgi:hypothetical protein
MVKVCLNKIKKSPERLALKFLSAKRLFGYYSAISFISYRWEAVSDQYFSEFAY